MNESIDPRAASVEELIEWLGDKRRYDPSTPLSSLLEGKSIGGQRLVDLACIDLMQRRRLGQTIGVEAYLEDLPDLRSESNLLDLIDAELCITAELKQSVDVDDYVRRFPEVADQVRELMQLEEQASRPAVPGLIDGHGEAESCSQPMSCSQSMDFSVDESLEDRPRFEISGGQPYPLDTPDWFIPEQCVANSPGRWLIRGRDSVRGTALALKVLELPAQLSSDQSEQLVDACRQAAAITHPSWVAPRVAAIQQRHLGVVRPWVFARSWDPDFSAGGDTAASVEVARRKQQMLLRRFASVAFSLAAAHQAGAAHGGIHSENLVVDHENVIRVIDAGSSQRGLQRWLDGQQGTNTDNGFASLNERRRIDAHDLIKLVAAAAVGWEQEAAHQLVAELRQTEQQHAEPVCAMMGQRLMRWSDEFGTESARPALQSRSRKHSWRKRLARWLIKEN